MISTRGRFIRLAATTVSASMFTMATPAVLWNDVGAFAASLIPEPGKQAESRLLTSEELGSLRGRTSGTPNPYIAGQSKWGVNYRGVDLLTGNFSFSDTDLSFEGGYGIPVAVTRTYSANNPDDGPLGIGWTLSVDLRTTAGGLLKGGSSPARTVPVRVVEKPLIAQHPGLPHWNPPGPGGENTNEPTEGVISEDASGLQTTVQRDVDGFLSPPAWDKNKVDVVYDTRMVNGEERKFTDHVTVTTPEGTIYYYDEFGFESDPANPGIAPGLSSVMKIQTVTDRHGNVTTYTYGATTHLYTRWTGNVYEQRLMAIDMPGGRGFDFEWNASGRITRITDGTREVLYGYGTGSQVASVTKPGNAVTNFVYGGIEALPSFGTLLRQITDPRDQITNIYYRSAPCHTPPLDSATYSFIDGVFCYKVAFPNSATLYVQNPFTDPDPGDPGAAPMLEHEEVTGAVVTVGGILERTFFIKSARDGDVLTVAVMASSGASHVPFILNEYDINSQDVLVSESYVYNPDFSNQLDIDRHFDYQTFNNRTGAPAFLSSSKIRTTTSYNYFGAPLSKTIIEDANYFGNNPIPDEPTKNIYYAYWGADKYYQQKAVIDPEGKVSFTDYFTAADPTGKGQVKTVYDDKHCAFVNTDPQVTGWRDSIAWQSGPAAATFTYDEEGRPLTVIKMAPVVNTTVTTKTTYSDAPGTYGNATKVQEDLGGANRTTETLLFDSIGRAIQVKDATNRTIETKYDDLGNVEWVKRISGTPLVLASYDYGDAGLDFGMLTWAKDGVSGQIQEITYYPSNEPVVAARGQVKLVEEFESSSLLPLYTTEYAYNALGDREKSKYTTPNGVKEYTYADYVAVGTTDGKRVFKTMTAVTNGGVGIQKEQFHYSFDSAGRIVHAAFMQTPQEDQFGVEQPYSAAYPALLRAHAYYLYDSGGRISELYNFFDNYVNTGFPQTSGYAYTNITGQQYAYDDQSGLRTETLWKESDPNGWYTQRTEAYSYDELGQLLSANYGNGSESWTYDGAGNRNLPGYSYDKLNRMTASPGGATYSNDVLGNRTWKNYQQASVQRYVWDEMGRLSSLCGLTQGAKYTYRVDGLRVKKVEGLTVQWVDDGSSESKEESSGYYDEHWATNKPTTRYYYDGQMSFEDDYTVAGIGSNNTVTVTRYALGARGIDGIETQTTGQNAAVVYPIYDGHGNMIATLAKNGTSFTRSNNREYGVWGDIRTGSGGDQGYVANLGHRKDAESGLTYMRARYYEPGTGRFISQDPARNGRNWFIYCSNDPVNKVDSSGKVDEWEVMQFVGNVMVAIGRLLLGGLTWSAESASQYIGDIIANEMADIAGKDVQALTTYLTLLRDMYEINRHAATFTRWNVYARWTGYYMIIFGQLMLTEAECLNPGGGSWWGYSFDNL